MAEATAPLSARGDRTAPLSARGDRRFSNSAGFHYDKADSISHFRSASLHAVYIYTRSSIIYIYIYVYIYIYTCICVYMHISITDLRHSCGQAGREVLRHLCQEICAVLIKKRRLQMPFWVWQTLSPKP